jgi:hypothetical protein
VVKLPFYSSCVDWRRDRLDVLSHLVDEGEEITRETFFRHVSADEIMGALGDGWYPHRRFYGYGFYRLRGYPIYWFTHSCIEFVFSHFSTMDRLARDLARARAAERRAERKVSVATVRS